MFCGRSSLDKRAIGHDAAQARAWANIQVDGFRSAEMVCPFIRHEGLSFLFMYRSVYSGEGVMIDNLSMDETAGRHCSHSERKTISSDDISVKIVIWYGYFQMGSLLYLMI